MPLECSAQSHPELADLPVVVFEEVLPHPPRVLIDDCFAKVDGSLGRPELRWILQLAKHHRTTGVLEIGTYFGSTTYNLAVNLPATTIHTIDLPPDFSADDPAQQTKDDLHLIRGRRVGEAFRDQPESSRIVQHWGDSATYDFSRIAQPLNFFFIDGSHNEHYAMNDSRVCLRLARGDSLLLWHDCDAGHPGVLRALAHLIAAGLPIARIDRSSTAMLRINSDDPRLRQVLGAIEA